MAKYCGLETCSREKPGPFQNANTRYNPSQFQDKSYLYKNSGTRDGVQSQYGVRNTVYNEAKRPNSGQCYNTAPPLTNPQSMAEAVEAQMGNCVPCRQDLAPAYGPRAEPNKFISYPVRAAFENRLKWNEDFGSPFAANPKGGQAGVPNDLPYGMKRNGPGGGPAGPAGAPAGVGGGNGQPFIPARANDQAVYSPRDPPPMRHDPVQLGCNITSSGDDQYAHRFTYLNRFFNEEDGEIMIQQPKGMDNKPYGQYNDQLFKTQADNSDNKVSTGVMVNPYTGEMFETFENAMPPPTTDKSLLPGRFEVVNPKLVWANGGIDPHAPLPKKKEICKSLPGVDGGPNVWGDQLYADERRTRMLEYANRDLWNNRNGDYSTVRGFAKEKPAGYTGYVPYYRPTPYLPPTQTLDNKDWVPVAHAQIPDGPAIKGEVFITKPDLTNVPIVLGAGPAGGVESEYVVQNLDVKPTWRGYADTNYNGPANFETQDFTGPSNTELRTTLKEQMETQFVVPVTDCAVQQAGGANYVVIDTTVRDTLKEQMETQFPANSADTVSQQTGGALYVMTNEANRSTLKEYMENTLPVGATSSEPLQGGGAGYVVGSRENRSTLKEYMENTLPVGATSAEPLQSGGAGYVVIDPTVRSTLKEYTELTLPAGAVASDYDGNYVVIDKNVKSTLKEQMEASFAPTGVATVTEETGGAEYVVIDRNARFTWKAQMETEFPANCAEDGYMDGEGYSGTWIPFQGPLTETARQFYENMPNVGRPAHSAYMGGDAESGSFVGNGLITSKQHRGTFATDYTVLSKVPADAEDTSTRWIGNSTRDTKRELVAYTPNAELSSYQSVVPRMEGAVSFLCNTDMHENDDEFNSLGRNMLYPVQQVITG